jgi:hypothetical protein
MEEKFIFLFFNLFLKWKENLTFQQRINKFIVHDSLCNVMKEFSHIYNLIIVSNRWISLHKILELLRIEAIICKEIYREFIYIY